MPRATTESFITELLLRTTPAQEKTLRARLEAARQVYNAALGESLRRLILLRESKLYQAARKMPKGKDRSTAFREAQKAAGFREFDLIKWGTQFTHCWINDHIDARSVESILSRAFNSAEMSMFLKRGKPRFRRFGEFNTLEGKSGSAVKWTGKGIRWNRRTCDLQIPAIIDNEDAVIRHGIESKVKYVRLTRRIEHNKDRYYAQLVGEGKPYHKPKNRIGEDTVGLDLGPSTIAVVGDNTAKLLRFCDELEPVHGSIRLIQRSMDRSRRASNPDNFNTDGTISKGKKSWKQSVAYRRRRRKLSEMRRREAAYRKNLHNRLVNEIYSIGNSIKTEKLSYKAFQSMFGKSVGFRAPGMFMQRLRDKAKALGLEKPYEFSTKTTKLSQTCHSCGRVLKKTLSQRWHNCECGVSAQRDLYSAFLARYVEEDRLHVDQAKAAWSGVCALLQATWDEAVKSRSDRHLPASFGKRKSRSQRDSSVEIVVNATKIADVVTSPIGRGESCKEVSGSAKARQLGGATGPPD